VAYIELDFANLRTLEGLLIERISNLHCLDMGGELFQEFIVNRVLHEDTRSSTTALSMVETSIIRSNKLNAYTLKGIYVLNSERSPFDSLIEVGICIDDIR
jgi:hypothetical protein